MSDPRSNLEIMDVLSSIRRLVSEDRKTAPTTGGSTGLAAQTVPVAEEPAAISGGARFVLTPALRVAEPDTPPGETDVSPDGSDSRWPEPKSDLQEAWARDAEAEEAAAEDAATAAVATSRSETSAHLPEAEAGFSGATPSLEETIAELEAAVGEIETDFEPDDGDADENVPEPVRQDLWASGPVAIKPTAEFHGIMAGFDAMTLAEDRLDTPITADVRGEASPPPPADFWRRAPATPRPTPGSAEPQPVPGANAVGAAAEPAPEQPSTDQSDTEQSDAEQIAPELFAGTLGARAKDWAGEEAETITGDEAENAIEPELAKDDESAEQMTATVSKTMPETLEEVGTARGRLHLGDYATGRPLIFRPDAASDAEAPLAIDGVDEDAGLDDGAGDEGLFDPLNASELDIDMLRDMVSEIIREELRGTLGERITRNLRQLVRREIERALEAERAARD